MRLGESLLKRLKVVWMWSGFDNPEVQVCGRKCAGVWNFWKSLDFQVNSSRLPMACMGLEFQAAVWNFENLKMFLKFN